MKRELVILTAAGLVVGGCGERSEMNPLAERGRQVYLAQCTACHAPDPAQAGPLGPPVKGSTRELLEAISPSARPPSCRPKQPWPPRSRPSPNTSGEACRGVRDRPQGNSSSSPKYRIAVRTNPPQNVPLSVLSSFFPGPVVPTIALASAAIITTASRMRAPTMAPPGV
jgi:hypothetical protein